MNVIERVLGGLRKIVLLEEKMERMDNSIGYLDGAVDEHDRRLIRLETVVQMAAGAPLPPLSPQRLPRR